MPSRFTEAEREFMRRALGLALRGQGRVEPNPMVGCLITHEDHVIAEGYHRRFGGPHAEVEALRRARRSVRGATAYVTLEPCCHTGKTPPCTDALLKAGVARVVAAMVDADPRVQGSGLRRLRRAGVQVDVGLLEAEATDLNRPYLKRTRHGKPYVILKWAQSVDGKIATRTRDSKWISGESSRRIVHCLRARVDAVMVGIGTVLADDPHLTARNVPVRRVATRVVLDTRLRTPRHAHVVTTAAQTPTLILTSRNALAAQAAKARQFGRQAVEITPVRLRRGRLDLTAVLEELGRRQMTNVLVEGGGEVISNLLDRRLADEAYAFVAPLLIGGRQAISAFGGLGVRRVSDCSPPGQPAPRRVGQDLLYHFVF
jgi:diaminohydroxyphosphoribosylaminopyrimidine deaminase/5-amino-6-(5-phosphoribosylamino)uracil reductase